MISLARPLLVVFIVLSLLPAPVSFAQSAATPGVLDLSFSSDGFTKFTAWQSAVDIAVQPDKKIVAAGIRRSTSTGQNVFALRRYTQAGSLDLNFSGDGRADANFFGQQPSNGGRIFILPDGKIQSVASLFSNSQGHGRFGVARMLPNGSKDQTFLNAGNGGFYTAPVPSTFSHFDRWPSGEALAVGVILMDPPDAMAAGIILARVNANGTLDSTFGANAYAEDRFVTEPGWYLTIKSVLLQPDGRIIVVSDLEQYNQNLHRVMIRRYNPDGSFDREYATPPAPEQCLETGGYTCTRRAWSSVTLVDSRIELLYQYWLTQPDGSGWMGVNLVRYHLDGSLDGGFESTNVMGFDTGSNQLLLQPDGKVISVGWSRVNPYNFSLTRFLAEGGFDEGFAGGMNAATAQIIDAPILRAALTPDSKLVAIGSSASGETAIARFSLGVTERIGVAWTQPQPDFWYAGNLPIYFSLTHQDGTTILTKQQVALTVYCQTPAQSYPVQVVRFNLDASTNRLYWEGKNHRYTANFKPANDPLLNPSSCNARVITVEFRQELGRINFVMVK